MSRRKEALSALREYLEMLPGPARVRLRQEGYDWSHTWPWPEPGAARNMIWVQIARAMESMEFGGTAEVKPGGRRATAVFAWPAMPGLFADAPVSSWPTPAENQELPEVHVLPMQDASPTRPAKASDRCAMEILSLLFDVQERRTCEEMETAFRCGASYHWSLSSIQATATWLRRQGRLDNGRDRRGVGYGLVTWDTDPCPTDE